MEIERAAPVCASWERPSQRDKQPGSRPPSSPTTAPSKSRRCNPRCAIRTPFSIRATCASGGVERVDSNHRKGAPTYSSVFAGFDSAESFCLHGEREARRRRVEIVLRPFSVGVFVEQACLHHGATPVGLEHKADETDRLAAALDETVQLLQLIAVRPNDERRL